MVSAVWFVPHESYRMGHAAWIVPHGHAAGIVPHGPCHMDRTAWAMPHACQRMESTVSACHVRRQRTDCAAWTAPHGAAARQKTQHMPDPRTFSLYGLPASNSSGAMYAGVPAPA
eukprot:359718-Chlamydomonas_euryale.AAC.4